MRRLAFPVQPAKRGVPANQMDGSVPSGGVYRTWGRNWSLRKKPRRGYRYRAPSVTGSRTSTRRRHRCCRWRTTVMRLVVASTQKAALERPATTGRARRVGPRREHRGTLRGQRGVPSPCPRQLETQAQASRLRSLYVPSEIRMRSTDSTSRRPHGGDDRFAVPRTGWGAALKKQPGSRQHRGET
jgi:hypothetical protein